MKTVSLLSPVRTVMGPRRPQLDRAAVLVVILVGVLAFVVLPEIFFLVDALLIAGGLLLLGGAWVIEASRTGPPAETRSWRVSGIFASRRAVAEVARELEHGDLAAAPDAAAT